MRHIKNFKIFESESKLDEKIYYSNRDVDDIAEDLVDTALGYQFETNRLTDKQLNNLWALCWEVAKKSSEDPNFSYDELNKSYRNEEAGSHFYNISSSKMKSIKDLSDAIKDKVRNTTYMTDAPGIFPKENEGNKLDWTLQLIGAIDKKPIVMDGLDAEIRKDKDLIKTSPGISTTSPDFYLPKKESN